MIKVRSCDTNQKKRYIEGKMALMKAETIADQKTKLDNFYRLKNGTKDIYVKKPLFKDKKFIDARLLKYLVSKQLKIEYVILILCIVTLLFSFISYSYEFDGNYGYKTEIILYIIMALTIIMAIYVLARNKIIVNLNIEQGNISVKNSSIFSVYPPYQVIAEFVFLIVHPSPWLIGKKMWIYHYSLNNNYFYHYNDI